MMMMMTDWIMFFLVFRLLFLFVFWFCIFGLVFFVWKMDDEGLGSGLWVWIFWFWFGVDDGGFTVLVFFCFWI
jgi:hypothetical protein